MSLKKKVCTRNRQTQKVKTQSDMKAWKQFCLQQHENSELCNIPGDELNLMLSKFFETVKKRQQLHFQHSVHRGAALPTEQHRFSRRAQGSKATTRCNENDFLYWLDLL